MRAIIETGGKQFTVAPDRTIRVPSLKGEPGDEVTLDRVLYVADGEAKGGFRYGSPAIDGATVKAQIVKHGRGKKIVVFKYKRRKRYRRKMGHRQNFTELRITGIEVGAETGAGRAEEASPLVCGECGKEYKTERGLNQHRAKEHGPTDSKS